MEYKMYNNMKSQNYVVICILIISFISFLARFEYRKSLEIDIPVRGDAYYYLSYAFNIVNHNTFAKEPTFNSGKTPVPDSYWAPGFPYLLSSALRIGGFDNSGFYHIATFYNAVLGGLLAPMIFYICIHFMPIGFAILASMMTALSPHLLSIGGYLLTETLLSFLIISSLLFFILWQYDSSIFYLILSGFLMGLAYLTNPIILFFPFVLACLFYFYKRNFIDKYGLAIIRKGLLLYLSVLLVIVAIWSVRTIMNVPADSLGSSNRATTNLMNGLYPNCYEDFANGSIKDPNHPMNIDIKLADGSIIKAFSIIAQKFRDNPFLYLKWYFVEKPIMLWSWDVKIGVGDVFVYPVKKTLFDISIFWYGVKCFYKIINPVLIFINFFGGGALLFYIFRDKTSDRSLFLVFFSLIIYSTGIYTVFQTDPRYSFPFRPLFYCCAILVFYESIKITKTYLNKR